MIYMTTDEWKEIAKIIEEKDWKELSTEIAIRTYDLDVSEQELDRLMMDYIANAKNNTKNNEEKRLWKIRQFVPYSISGESDIRELTETEAIEWYNKYTPTCGMKKGKLFYKKEGEWVVYEITK